MILKELSEAIGISGDEGAVRKIILKAIEGHAEDIHIDALGNITARKAGSDGEERPESCWRRTWMRLASWCAALTVMA